MIDHPILTALGSFVALTSVFLFCCLSVASGADEDMEKLMNKLREEKDMEKKFPKQIRERIMKFQRDKKGRILRDCDGNHLGHRIGIMEAFLLDDKVHIGFSICDEHDKYSPERAEFVTGERAFACWKKPLTIPPMIMKQYLAFRKRCEKHFEGYPLPDYKEFHGKNIHTLPKTVSSYLDIMERSNHVSERGVVHTAVEGLKTKYERPTPAVEPAGVVLGDAGLEHLEVNAEDVPDYLLKEINK